MKIHGNKGKKLTDEHKRKIGESNKITCTPEIRGRYSEMYKGKKRPNFAGDNHPFYGKHHSFETVKKIRETLEGKRKQEVLSYTGKHKRISQHNGKAYRCENKEDHVLNFICKNISSTFQWALKKGHLYTADVEDYFQLCLSCHKIYDIND